MKHYEPDKIEFEPLTKGEEKFIIGIAAGLIIILIFAIGVGIAIAYS